METTDIDPRLRQSADEAVAAAAAAAAASGVDRLPQLKVQQQQQEQEQHQRESQQPVNGHTPRPSISGAVSNATLTPTQARGVGQQGQVFMQPHHPHQEPQQGHQQQAQPSQQVVQPVLQLNQQPHHQQQQQQQQHNHHVAGNAFAHPHPALAPAVFSPKTPSSSVDASTSHYHHHVSSAASSPALGYGMSSAGPPGQGVLIAAGPDGHDPSGDPRKPRACESCRALKVRCDPEPANVDGPCRRCLKANRQCVITQPTRKRQKKTDSRVAELEKKIDALTASLQATKEGAGGPAWGSNGSAHALGSLGRPSFGGVSVGAGVGPQVSGSTSLFGPGSIHGGGAHDWATAAAASGSAPTVQKRASGSQQTPEVATVSVGHRNGVEVDSKTHPPAVVMAGQKRKHTETRDSMGDDAERDLTAGTAPPSDRSDVVNRGIITMSMADELFTRYTDQMAPHLPGVVFAAGTTAAQVRQTRPVLFLSIMAAASSEYPHTQRQLNRELMHVFADRIIIVGEKSLEMVQALQIAVLWYWPPEHFEQLKFYQLVHMAAVMAIDIGLGSKRQPRGGLRKHIPYALQFQPWRKHSPPDPTSVDSRRAWLTCYFMATNTAMALHRPNLVRWSNYMSECLGVLESSPDAAPTDKYLCHLVWSHRLSEEVGIQFAMDDSSVPVNMADPRTQYALKGFERDLEKYSASIPDELRQPSLQLTFHVLSLYMHEIATQNEVAEDVKQQQADGPESLRESMRDSMVSDTPLTAAHISAISACLTAIDGIFDVFLSMDVPSTRCLPVFNFVRVAYAVVVLIKMYFAASSPKSELGKVINKDHMKVEQHLDNLLIRFRETAAEDKNRPAAKFLMVLVMLRSWFQKQNQAQRSSPTNAAADTAADKQAPSSSTPISGGGSVFPTPGKGASAEGSGPTQPQTAQLGFVANNTGLHLLSEIATHNSDARRTSADIPVSTTAPPASSSLNSSLNWYPANGNAIRPAGTLPVSHYDPATAPAFVPWLNDPASLIDGDFDYASLGHDFAQAMDLTMAGMADGSLGLGMENGMRYVMSDPPWLFEMANSGVGGEGGASGGYGQF